MVLYVQGIFDKLDWDKIKGYLSQSDSKYLSQSATFTTRRCESKCY